VSGRILTGFSRLGLASVGIAFALAAMSHPSSAQDAAKPAGANDAAIKKGREVFDNYGCGSCHSLADAGATGHVGPSFDGDANLTEPFVANRVANGQGGMPAFSGQMTADEIAAVASYVTHAASK
jgi:mono/diheme cytochrome c family protein